MDVFSKIDRAIANVEWMQQLSYLEATIMDPGFSDHSQIAISFDNALVKGSMSFRFLNFLALHPTFLQLVEEAWSRPIQWHLIQQVWACHDPKIDPVVMAPIVELGQLTQSQV